MTYRGKEVKIGDPMYKPLDPRRLFEISLMCRSGFGKQAGEFGVVVLGIGGWRVGDKGEGKVREGCWCELRRWLGMAWSGDRGGHIRLERDEKA